MNPIEHKIDFTTVRDELRRRCTSPLGKEQVDAMAFSNDPAEITRLLDETDEMKRIFEDGSLDFPRGEIHDMREPLARIRIEGLFLDEAELFDLSKTIDYAARLQAFFAALDPARFPRLSALSIGNNQGNNQGILFVLRLIEGILDKYGRLADNASPELSRIRREMAAAQGSVSRALHQILRQAQAEGLLDKDAAPTMREGRLVIPVPPAYKRKIGGIVHDESATGKTVFVEPQQVVEANNHIRELEGAERRERIRILQDITSRLRPSLPDIKASEQALAYIDFLRAKAEYARALLALRPTLHNEPMLQWRQARHPILYLKFRQQGKTLVPLSLRLKENRMLIISGPNAGGKSVCLKTVALLQYMLQCGLLVPLDEGSEMGIFRNILVDIGDEQSIEDDLSTYSGHLRNMKDFLRQADARTLLLIDEFGSGTEPLIGGAIAEAILTQLVSQGAFGVITTHYTNLKHFAEQTPSVINGAMLYDRGQMRPLFQLSVGQAGSSFAVEIARNIGLPEAIIAHATELVGEEHIDYDKQLQDIARDKRYWENKRQNIRQREKHLEERIAFYEQEIAGLKAKKKVVMDEAKQQAADLLQKSNATIERTIREIKEAQADKARTQQARARVEAMKEKVKGQQDPLQLPLQRGRVKKSLSTTESAPTPALGREGRGESVFRDFAALRHLTLSNEGPTHLLKEKTTKRSTLNAQPSTINYQLKRKADFTPYLDLRGMRVDEALETFIRFMDDAVMVNAGEVTVLHGTGTGALKQLVRDYLNGQNAHRAKYHRSLFTFRDGDPDRGGAGITIINV
ncbi:MAG: endonuclease MutS2 [Paludibacteraceae bacterium]